MNQLTTIQQGWLKLAEIRIDLFDRLRLDELACQGELKDIENLPLEKMQSALKSAKLKTTDDEKIVKKTSAKRSEKDPSKDVNE